MKMQRIFAGMTLFCCVGTATADLSLVDFGNVPVGSSTVQNVAGHGWVAGPTDNCTFQISAMSLSGQDAGDFTASTQCVGVTIGHGESCYGPLTFHPSGTGVKNASLVMQVTIFGTYANGGACQWAGGGTVTSISRPLMGNGIPAASLAVFDPNAGVPAILPPVVQSVTPRGDAAALSLSVRMRFDASIAGQRGDVFVGAHVPAYGTARGLGGTGTYGNSEKRLAQEVTAESWLISNGSNWTPLGATIPSYFSGTLNDASGLVNILDGVNTAGLCGTEFYVGYGSSAESMLANGTLGRVYTVMCNFAFSGSPSGASAALSLSANIQVATVDAGRSGSFYVGKLYNGQWSLHNGSGWVAYGGGEVPAYTSGLLSSRTIQVLSNENLSGQTSAQIFAGYGLTSEDLLNNRKYGLVHTVQ